MIAASIGNTHHFDEDEVFIRLPAAGGPAPQNYGSAAADWLRVFKSAVEDASYFFSRR
jgi:hypothetical protein